MRRLAVALLLGLVAGCGDEPEIPAGTKAWLETRAGILAPAVTLSDSLAARGPDSAVIAELLRVCDSDPGLYCYFYACLVDTIGTMEEPPVGPQEEPRDSAATSP